MWFNYKFAYVFNLTSEDDFLFIFHRPKSISDDEFIVKPIVHGKFDQQSFSLTKYSYRDKFCFIIGLAEENIMVWSTHEVIRDGIDYYFDF